MYLIDTNVLSEARDWLRSVDPDRRFLSVVTLGEIMKGVSLRAPTDPAAAAAHLSTAGVAPGYFAPSLPPSPVAASTAT